MFDVLHKNVTAQEIKPDLTINNFFVQNLEINILIYYLKVTILLNQPTSTTYTVFFGP